MAHSAGPQAEKPEWLKERLGWFQDLKFGLIFHWGPYCQWDCCESWPLSPGDDWARNDNMECWTSRGKDLAVFQRDYWALNRTFNPLSYDPDSWAEAAARAGVKYVAFTTKHHDGFCMWDTATTDYRVTGEDCPFHAHPRADVFGELCRAFQARGMAISAYFSKADWRSPHYWSPDHPVVSRQANTVGTPDWDRFVEFTHQQIRELMSRYGKIDVLWLDAGWVKSERGEDLDMEGMAALARELQPGLIIANRTVGDAYEDFITPEHQIPEEPLDTPWESCLCMGGSWKYEVHDRPRPTAEILKMLIDVVSKGGNLLLGIGPTPEGTIGPEFLRALGEIGEWMAVNSEAIHRTRAIPPFRDGETRFVQKDGFVHAFLMDEGQTSLSALGPPAGAEVRLLGCDDPVIVTRGADRVTLSLPPSSAPLPRPLVVRWHQED